MARVLVVDDDEHLQSLIDVALVREGHVVTGVGDGAQALEQVRRQAPDLVILDVMLPGLDGFAVCQRIRRFSDVPILVLSVRRSEDDKVKALELGADDYLAKPFGHRELQARVRALLRRPSRARARAALPVRTARFHLREEVQVAVVDGRSISLTPTEFRILRALVANPGRVLSPAALMSQVQSYSYTRQEAQEIVKVHIRRLRQKIERDPDLPDYILNVRGVGYTFRVPDLLPERPAAASAVLAGGLPDGAAAAAGGG